MTTKAYLAAAIVALSATSASAATFNGEFWDANPANLNSIGDAINYATNNPADQTFDSTSIDYGDPSASPAWKIGTLGNFLQADSGNLSGGAGTDFLGSVIRLTGKSFLSNGETISVTSDDGFKLLIGGSVFSDFPGERGPNNTTSETFGGTSGVYDVELWYFEGQATQAQLQSNLSPVPLPAAGVLLLGALGGLGGASALRRRRKTA